MTRPILLALALAIALPGAAQAACFADYKAKRDKPLRLHYGVAEITGPCTKRDAADDLRPRLEADDWTLLNVVSVFDDTGLKEREASAGKFYLRY